MSTLLSTVDFVTTQILTLWRIVSNFRFVKNCIEDLERTVYTDSSTGELFICFGSPQVKRLRGKTLSEHP